MNRATQGVTLLSLLAALAVFHSAFAEEAPSASQQRLYAVYSQDVGWSRIYLEIREVSRTQRISLFHVPGYAGRSAMESRFAMCAFSQAALLRGFTHWVDFRSRPVTDNVQVGFYNADTESPEGVFDEGFAMTDRTLPPSAAQFAGVCRFFHPETGANLALPD